MFIYGVIICEAALAAIHCVIHDSVIVVYDLVRICSFSQCNFLVVLLLVIYIAIVIVICVAAQMMSYWALRLVQASLGVKPRHFHHCRSCTAACIAIGSAIQMPTLMSVALVSTMTFVVPRRWLWFPALKRPAACMVDDPSALPTPDAKQRRGASPATLQDDCEFLAAALTKSANTKTSSVAASTKGLDFNVVLKSIYYILYVDQNSQLFYFGVESRSRSVAPI